LHEENTLIQEIAPLRILIIEDTEERQKILTSLYRSHAWILVNTGPRAITLLKAYDFDIISLDYNLRGDFNGADVAQVRKCSRNKNARIVVHSLNPKGVEQISKILPDAIAYPVSKMVRSNQAFKRLRSKIDELGADYDWT
jgi:CheY-like chemotaxis protein